MLLGAHLDDCPACREFAASMDGFTQMLRTAQPEALARPIEIGRLRRRMRLRLAPAVAAMAVTAVGLGSLLASSDLRTRSLGHASGGVDSATSVLASVDTMNLSTANAVANASTEVPRITAAGRSSLHGGPVINKR